MIESTGEIIRDTATNLPLFPTEYYYVPHHTLPVAVSNLPTPVPTVAPTPTVTPMPTEIIIPTGTPTPIPTETEEPTLTPTLMPEAEDTFASEDTKKPIILPKPSKDETSNNSDSENTSKVTDETTNEENNEV